MKRYCCWPERCCSPRAARPIRQNQRAFLIVSMSGIQEVPGPGDPDGNGTVEIRVDAGATARSAGTSMRARSGPATAAHIHRGAAGSAGAAGRHPDHARRRRPQPGLRHRRPGAGARDRLARPRILRQRPRRGLSGRRDPRPAARRPCLQGAAAAGFALGFGFFGFFGGFGAAGAAYRGRAALPRALRGSCCRPSERGGAERLADLVAVDLDVRIGPAAGRRRAGAPAPRRRRARRVANSRTIGPALSLIAFLAFLRTFLGSFTPAITLGILTLLGMVLASSCINLIIHLAAFKGSFDDDLGAHPERAVNEVGAVRAVAAGGRDQIDRAPLAGREPQAAAPRRRPRRAAAAAPRGRSAAR